MTTTPARAVTMPTLHISRPRVPVETGDENLFPCCMASAMRGPGYCTCWEAVYDMEQQPSSEPPHGGPGQRLKQCHDCAYRKGSPEAAEDDDFLSTPLPNFYCHQGMRRVVAWKHPDGRVRTAGPGNYEPLIDQWPRKADGSPASLCAGWWRLKQRVDQSTAPRGAQTRESE